MIYFIAPRDLTRVKIGFTRSQLPWDRLAQLLEGHATCDALLVVALQDGDRAYERALHDRFRHLLVRQGVFRPIVRKREWFVFDEEIRKHVWRYGQRVYLPEASDGAFFAWLMLRRYDDSVVGDLAGDVLGDCDFPRGVTTRADLLEYVENRARCTEAIEAADEAWRAFAKECCDECLVARTADRARAAPRRGSRSPAT